MKKNSFKKLSFVLALAMIISAIAPAAGAFAATKAPKLNSTKQYLHLGVEGSEEYDFNVSNKKSGWKYAWTTSNKDIANVNKTNGLVIATGVGTAKISCEITDKDGDLVTELTASVVVRDNIKTLAITNTPANNKLLVGVSNDFNRSFVTVSGATDKTSAITRWTVDKDGATIDDKGLFVATKAGEFTITANAFQSTEKYNLWKADSDANAKYLLASATYKVTVAASMTAKQTDSDTLTVTFTAPVSNIDATRLVVSEVVSGYKVKKLVKTITPDADKKVAVVDMYGTFTPGTVYVVEFPDVDSSQFTAATKEIKDVADMQIVTSAVTVGTATAIDLKFFNKDGVDITTNDMKARVTLKSSSEKAYLSGNMLTIFAKDDTTTITAEYHTYNYDSSTGKEIGVITKTAVVRGVENATTTIASLSSWSIAGVNGSGLNFDSANHIIAAEDSNVRLFVKYIMTDKETYKQSNSAAEQAKFTYTSTNTDVLIVRNDGSTNGTLFPVKAGSAQVIISYEGKVIDAITLNILPKRVATNLVLDNYAFTLSNSANVADTKIVSIDVKDQYNVSFGNSSVTVVKSPSAANVDLVKDGAANVLPNATSVTFVGAGITAGSYTYAITANNITKYVSINVLAPSDATSVSYKLNLDTTSMDATVTANTPKRAINVKVFGYAANGVANNIASVSGSTFTVQVVAPNGSIVDAKYLSYSPDGKSVEILVGATVTGKPVLQLAAGTYRIRLLNKTTNQLFDQTNFEVTNWSSQPTVTTKLLVSTKSDVTEAVKECFQFFLNGSEITNSITVPADGTIGTGVKTVYIKHVVYKQIITDGSYIEYQIPVNTTITLQ